MTEIKRIGVLTGGGDAPGLNVVIRAVAKAASNAGIVCTGSSSSDCARATAGAPNSASS